MLAGEWTPEAATAIELCGSWTKMLSKSLPCDVYLFGSVIYEGGDQFDPKTSDIDLVVEVHDSLDATNRADSLSTLRNHKAHLELQIIPTLHRTNCEDPGVSIIPIWQLELQANIHKSGARRFFDKNIFLNLVSMQQSIAIPAAGTHTLAEEARQALEYTQKVRNQYLAVSANGLGGIPDYDGPDPIPKALSRAAAQLVPDAEIGAWYDTRFGLEHLFSELTRRRTESESLKRLHRILSVRRGGRGHRRPLDAFDQLLLTELLFDLAATTPLQPIATWDIRFLGVMPVEAERERLLDELRKLVPDAQVIGVFDGSIVVRLRSSKRSYLTVSRLSELGVLPGFFGVDGVELSNFQIASGRSRFELHSALEKIADRIAKWRPRAGDSRATTEANLAALLGDWLRQDPSLSHAVIVREALVLDGLRPTRADISIQFREGVEGRALIVEIMRLRSRSAFFHQLERILRLSLPTIFVVIGEAEQLTSLQSEFDKLADIQGSIRIVPIPIDGD